MTPFYADDLITLYHCRCEDFMAECQDKQFELAICDPPFGGGDIAAHIPRAKGTTKNKIHTAVLWNNAPSKEYFISLFRISENQIIWGANHYPQYLESSRGWIFWDKIYENTFNFSAGELAYTSFDRILKMVRISQRWIPNTPLHIHPCQKPVALYRWLLQNYAKPGWTIFDSHGGSLSLAIACHDLGFKLVATECDLDYLTAAVNRIKNYLKQPKWFKPSAPAAEQTTLF
jgi:site-specific DNA-methyltransferase (adenine-specific)